MTEFWQNLSSRERLLIMIGGGLFALFIVFQFMVKPVVDWRGDAASDAAQARGLYEMVAEASAFGGGASASDADLDTPVRNALTETSSPNGIALNYVEVRGDGAVVASLGAAAPENLFRWLNVLERRFGVTVIAADIARENGGDDLVRATVTFSRGGA